MGAVMHDSSRQSGGRGGVASLSQSPGYVFGGRIRVIRFDKDMPEWDGGDDVIKS
jgi:hypothetical protein